MGLFDGLFEKKSCGVCGKELGLLGKRKLEDGYICKDCASKLSPFFSERRASTLDQIKDQLEYREANKDAVAVFNVTRTLGVGKKVLIDEDARKFIVSSSSRWRDENPDVIDFSQVTGCEIDVRENRSEIKKENEDGTKSSYDPPRWDIDYEIYVTIHINSPWFDEIRLKTHNNTIESRLSIEFDSAERVAVEIREALMGARQEVRDAVVAANTPKVARTCPHCNATTIPDASGRCEYCGGAIDG